MKKHLPIISIFIIIIGTIVLGIYFSEKNSPLKQLAKLNVYSKEELSFLEKEGFLDNIDSENLPSNKEGALSLLKSPGLIEQNLNSPDESFEVLATKLNLNQNTYQLAFKLENKSNQEKEFYLIPISESSQTEFKEIKGVVKGGKVNLGNQGDWGYDIEKHKQELRPELAKAYDDIDNNGYIGKPIKLVLEANSTLLAQSKWEISRGPTSDSLEPVYLLVYGSAGGAMDELYKDTSFEKLDKVEKIKEDHFKIKYDKYSEVEIGNLETDDFEPTAKLEKWGDETFIKVKFNGFDKKVKPKQEDKKLKWKGKDKEVHLYPLEPREFEENGHQVKQGEAFEFEVILKKKPATNKIVLDIETKGLKFFYQRELTQEKKDRGAFRPENVVGSYAVYHETQDKFFKTKEEGDKYKAGKAFHIYRPKITDAIGNWIWGKLNIDIEKNLLTVEIPQDFLDNAVYPIRHAAGLTFGFESIGESYDSTGDTLSGTLFTGAAGTGVSISAGVSEYDHGGEVARCGIYLHNNLSFVTNSRTEEKNIQISPEGWVTFNFETAPTLSAVEYVVSLFGDYPEGYFYYDGGDASQKHCKYGVSGYPTFPDPFTAGYSHFAEMSSIYVTYTPGAPPSVTTNAATSVQATTATLNGNVTSDGGATITERGFYCDTNASPSTKYTVAGTTGAYTKGMTTLSSGTKYYFKAFATNSVGTSYGSILNFTTKPAAPTGVSATDGAHTDKVTITWTKSTGATGYQVYRNGAGLGWLGDVATYNDTGAAAPTITPGTAAASDGASTDYVALSLSGQSANNGTTYTYKVRAKNATGESGDSGTNTGYRGVGTLTYQWQRSAADSDADYSNITDATTASYNDTGAPADGSGRYYRCVENATGAAQEISSVNRGYRANTAPTISSVSDYPDPIQTGNDITFSVDWNDINGEGIKMYICKADDGGTSGCGGGGTWCSNSNDYDEADPITCAYTTQAGDVNSSKNYYVHVCDNEPSCSSSTFGTFTVEAVSTPSIIIK